MQSINDSVSQAIKQNYLIVHLFVFRLPCC